MRSGTQASSRSSDHARQERHLASKRSRLQPCGAQRARAKCGPSAEQASALYRGAEPAAHESAERWGGQITALTRKTLMLTFGLRRWSRWSRCGRSAARPAAGSGGRSERQSRAQRALLSRTAHGHSSLFDGARVLSAAGPRRPLIGGRACEAARARVRRMQRHGRIAFCFHSVVYVRCRTMYAWRMPTKRIICAHLMCL